MEKSPTKWLMKFYIFSRPYPYPNPQIRYPNFVEIYNIYYTIEELL